MLTTTYKNLIAEGVDHFTVLNMVIDHIDHFEQLKGETTLSSDEEIDNAIVELTQYADELRALPISDQYF